MRPSTFVLPATALLALVACGTTAEDTEVTTSEADITAAETKIFGKLALDESSPSRNFVRTARCNGYELRVRGNDTVRVTFEASGKSYGGYLLDANWNELAVASGDYRRTLSVEVPAGGTYYAVYCDANFHGKGREIAYRVTASASPVCIASCAAAQKNCGVISDRCGFQMDCGECADTRETCGGAGVANVCGVPKPTTCSGPPTWSQEAKLADNVSQGNAVGSGRGLSAAVDGTGRLHVAYSARTPFDGDRAYYVRIEPRGAADKPVDLGPGHEVSVATTTAGDVHVAVGAVSSALTRYVTVLSRDPKTKTFRAAPVVTGFGSPSLAVEESGTLALLGLGPAGGLKNTLEYARKGAADADWSRVPIVLPTASYGLEDHAVVVDSTGAAKAFFRNGDDLFRGTLALGSTSWSWPKPTTVVGMQTLRAAKDPRDGTAVATYSPVTPYPIGAFAIDPAGTHHLTSAVPHYPFRHTDGSTETDLGEDGVKASAIAIDPNGVVNVVYLTKYAQIMLRRRAPSCP